MDLSTSIADLSISMSQAKFQQDLGVSLLKKAMDTSTDMASGVIEMMDNSTQTFAGDVGAVLDVRA